MMRSLKPLKVKPDYRASALKSVFLLLLLVSPAFSDASFRKLPGQNNWFISGNTGIAVRSTELSGALNFTDDGFRHQPGPAFAFSFGKTFGNRWEPAIRWGAYTLFGQSSLPHYSSAGYYAAYPGLLKQEPLEYSTQSNTLSLMLRFIFSKKNKSDDSYTRFRPFIEAGWGVTNYVTEVRYSKIPPGETASLLFRDRNGKHDNGTAQLTTGMGFKIGQGGKWNAEIILNAAWVGFSTLNVVSQITNPAEYSSRALVTSLSAGLTIPFKKTVKRDRYMPFRW